MDNSKLYLLKAIVGYKTNEYPTLGELNGKHVDDIAKLMNAFLKESLLELIPMLNDGGMVDVDGLTIRLNHKKRKPKK